jgi:hypothetical protein
MLNFRLKRASLHLRDGQKLDETINIIERMKPKEIMQLTFRFIGLMGVLYVVNHINFCWHKSGSLFRWHKTGMPYEHSLWQFIFELGLILIGFYMVFGCPLFMKAMFPEKKSDSPGSEFKNKNE